MSRVISPFLPTLAHVSSSFPPFPCSLYPLNPAAGSGGKPRYAKYIQVGLSDQSGFKHYYRLFTLSGGTTQTEGQARNFVKGALTGHIAVWSIVEFLHVDKTVTAAHRA